MTCFAVSLIWSHRQINERKFKTQVLFRKTASLLQSVQICVIIELSVFCSCTWSLIALWLRDSTFSKFYSENLSVQQCFHLCINACFADTFIISSDLSECSAYWVWCSLTVSLNSLYHICSLFWICLQDLMTSFLSLIICDTDEISQAWYSDVDLETECRFQSLEL
jgi:hypothetical protein